MQKLIFHLDWPNFSGNKSGTTYLFNRVFPEGKHIRFKPSTNLIIKLLQLIRALAYISINRRVDLVFTEVGNLRYGVFDIVCMILDLFGREYTAMVHMTTDKLTKWYYKPSFIKFTKGNLITYNSSVVAELHGALSVTIIPHFASETYYSTAVKEDVVIINGKQQRDIALINAFINDNKDIKFWAVNVDVNPSDNVIFFPRLNERTLAYLYSKAKYSLCLYQDLNGSNVLSNSIVSGCIPIISHNEFYKYYTKYMKSYVYYDTMETIIEGGGEIEKLNLIFAIDAIRKTVRTSSVL